MPATKALLIILAVLAVLFTGAGAVHLLTRPEQATAGKDTGAQQSQQPAAQPQTQAAPPQDQAQSQPILPVQPSTVVPTYDVVRIEKGGEGVIAGRAQPDWRVIVQSGDDPVAEATADRDGEWVAILKQPLSPGEHSLSLHAYSPNGNRGLISDQTVVVSVAGSSEEETVVALAEPGKPTQILQREPAAAVAPEAAPQPQDDTRQTDGAQAPQAAAPTPSAQADASQPSAAPPPASASPEPEQSVAAAESEPRSTAPEPQKPATQTPQAVAPAAPPAAAPAAQEERTGSTEPAAQPQQAPEEQPAAQPQQAPEEQPAAQPQQAPEEQPAVSAPPAAATSEPRKQQERQEQQEQQIAAPTGASSAPASAPKRQGQMAAASASGTATSSGPSSAEPPSAPQEPAAARSAPAETTVAKTPPAEGTSRQVARAVPADDQPAPTAEPAPQTSAKPEARQTRRVAFDTVDYEDAAATGKVFLSGVAEPGAKLMIYLNNDLIAEIVAGEDGKWTLTQDKQIAPGSHVMRADQVQDDGKVISRAEITFERAAPESVVASLEQIEAGMKAKEEAKKAEMAAMERQRQAAALSAAAPTKTRQRRAAKRKKRRTHHTVRRGDTLWDIAEHHYGKGWRYTAIYRRNRGQIRNPHLIYPNQRFRVSR